MRWWSILGCLGALVLSDVDIPQVDAPSSDELEAFESEDHDFMAETDRLMNILVNSLYTDRDVFVRELISNAADALEKIRLQGLQNPKILKGSSGDPFDEYKILIKIDKEKNELSFTDTGIGMTKQELINNLGTVAKSGTKSFLEAAQKGASVNNLIGQFGVGFYSAFLVAEEVTVISKSPLDTDQYIWKSSANGKFKVLKDKRHDKLERGTSVILTLKEDAQSYLEKGMMRKVISRFSEFVNFPIFLASVKPNDDVVEWKLINAQKPLWLRDRSNITKEEYDEFYKSFFKDRQDPMAHVHFNAEGDLEFSAIMYVPNSNREDIAMLENQEGSKIKLYVQQVLISDSMKDFMPTWLKFVRGVIHSKDLPLKVDRETFTQSRVMRIIKKKTINRVYELIRSMSRDADREIEENADRVNELLARQAESPDRETTKQVMDSLETEFPKHFKYGNFWNKFGNTIVFGCMNDATKDDTKKVMEIFRTFSTKRKDTTSLGSYVTRMKPGQQKIYYLTGDDIEAMKRSPYMEFFLKNDIEVLLLTGAFEEACLNKALKYKDYTFQSIEKDEMKDNEFAFLEAGDDEKKQHEVGLALSRDRKAKELYYEPLLQWVKDAMGLTRVQSASLSRILVTSPALITSPAHGFTAAHEKLVRTSLAGNQAMFQAFAMMKNFELNPDHSLIHSLLEHVKDLSDRGAYSSREAQALNHTLDILYECAMIASGYPPRRPHLIIQDIYQNMAGGKLDKDFRLMIPPEVYARVDAGANDASKDEDVPDFDMNDFDLNEHDEL